MEVVGHHRRSLSNWRSYVQPWRLRWTTAVVTRSSCLPRSFSFIREVKSQLTTSPLFLPLQKSQGSNATGDCCSKCYNAILKKEGATATATQPTTPTAAPAASIAVTTTAAPTNNNDVTMTEATSSAPVQPTTTTVTAEAAEPEKKKKKKKKVSYKSMMANMTSGNGSPRDAEKDKEGIKKVTGGGAFSKIDKI